MRFSTWIGFGLGLYYLIAGFGYALTSHFVDGFPLMMGAAVSIALFGGYAYLAVRRGELDLASREHAVEPVEPHVGSTIWPFGYAVAAIAFVVAFLAYSPLYALAAIMFLAATVGWFDDVRRQWQNNGEDPSASGLRTDPDPIPLQGEESP
jgi:hypothetical protein